MTGVGEPDSDAEEVEGDDASDERHLFGEERPTAAGFVAGRMGVLRVELGPDRIGGFGMVDRRSATDIAASGGRVVVATDEDVLLATSDADEFTLLGFGPAVAVGIDGKSVFAAAPDGSVGTATIDHGAEGDAEWRRLGDVSDPRRFDGDLLATEDGVMRSSDGLDVLGLSDVNDVARRDASGDLLVGTADGLYARDGDDWNRVLDESIARLSFDGDDGLAVTADGRVFRGGDSWSEVSLPGGKDAFDAASGESLYIVTKDGEMLIAAESAATSDGVEGWRTQPLGVRDVTGFALLDG